MGVDEQRKATAPPGYVCRSCKEPVVAVVKRHKTIGVFVPVWTTGPCQNPQCLKYMPEQEPINPTPRGTRVHPTGWESGFANESRFGRGPGGP
ncbi:hypothetical protein ACFWMJ_35250 [Streptomyces hawaiiensis]|uniref:hypothetical protein n=1 Tax=Streptomyces hawaiiensis TaxID=67305 RepID=UPI003669EA1A